VLHYKNTKTTPVPDALKANSSIAPKKKQRTLVFNHDVICAEYQASMLAGLSLSSALAEKGQVSALVLGTGAGLLPMFLRRQLGDKAKQIVTVDISKEMVDVSSLIIINIYRLPSHTSVSLRTQCSSQ
jgi:tRNA1(Val) A37 N6-methylase TrmN6